MEPRPVGAVVRYIKTLLDTDDLLSDLWVEGEVSNYVRSSAGHLYFTLKDADGQLRCVMWHGRADRLDRLPQDGDQILAHGYVSLYEVNGAVQFYVDTIRPTGLGLLQQQFEALKARLDAEGLFDSSRKRPLPAFPRRIGVVTSPTGAAIRDILHVLGRRYPLAEVILAPTPVQGDGAAPQIAAAIAALDGYVGVDVILVARGGGSLEDLWPFNEERVARAIFACGSPVVSGVGHETDFTIADYVADLRAPTPSAAAEQAVPDAADLVTRVAQCRGRLDRALTGCVMQAREQTRQRHYRLARHSPTRLIAQRRQEVDERAQAAARSLRRDLALRRERLDGLHGRLLALSPLATLGRGYAVVHHQIDGRLVTSVGQVRAGDGIAVRVADGVFGAEVMERQTSDDVGA
ncbi:MAG: exodeoxyribonuclease VII large subunit [Chloroflexi bacterium]|nr:exodeoxyribonuclease VII large subunit [Chloroflexota bacterium]MBU1746766.1 exodeoxyribonuclease VII large subunit [Chloroflexota bacterium]MBU1877534.1 exodeoxyribonuclease VII large subunit [Chloroflexota bacterium]